jgi:hypothetical protein
VDFQLYARVLWRFKLLILFGLVVASSLGVLSVLHVSTNGVSYRESELWSSRTRLLVTQQGFPWGRLLALDPSLEAQQLDIPLADPNRLNTLTILYAEFATSDPVRRLMRRDGPIRGEIIATPVVVQEGRYSLPLIDLMAISTSPHAAVDLTQRSADALRKYLHQQQSANRVPSADRVVIQEVIRPRGAEIFRPRSKTMPVVVFLAVMLVTVGLAFLLENLRPRVRPGEQAEVEAEGLPQRRSA